MNAPTHMYTDERTAEMYRSGGTKGGQNLRWCQRSVAGKQSRTHTLISASILSNNNTPDVQPVIWETGWPAPQQLMENIVGDFETNDVRLGCAGRGRGTAPPLGTATTDSTSVKDGYVA